MNSQVAIRFGRLTCLAILGLVVLPLTLAPAAGRGADNEEGFKPIFDGKTLDGWDGDPKFWSVRDGTITGQTTKDNPTKDNTFIIWRGGEPADFELKLECRLRNHNSGIQFRSWEEPEKWGKWIVGGYQADIADNGKYDGMLYGERYRGFLAPRGEATVIGNDHKPKVVGKIGDADKLLSCINSGDWNAYHIIAKGNRLSHWINGHQMVQCTDNDERMRRQSGIIALQLHAGEPMMVQFRNIRLKTLDTAGEKAGETKNGNEKMIVFIAGGASHGYGCHEHKAGCLLLAECLNENMPGARAVVHSNGWPNDPTALADAAAIVIFSDGGDQHPAMGHLDSLGRLMEKGVGLACLHYAVDIPKGDPGDCLKDWIGGYFETNWSVNPMWLGKFDSLPNHPIARGVKPFEMYDEWYYHMRFQPEMKGIAPILTAVPPDDTRQRPDGSHSNNPTVRARIGLPEHVAWAYERPGGGARVWVYRRTLALELGLPRLPHSGAGRHCMDRRPGDPARWRVLQSPHFRPVGSQPGRTPAGRLRPGPLAETGRPLATGMRMTAALPTVIRLTPPGRGAVATLLVEGPGASRAVQTHFHTANRKPLASVPADRLVFGHFGPSPGEEVIVRRRSGQWVEVHCHGGEAAAARIEGLLIDEGRRTVGWRDWLGTRREDPIATAARLALATARTERTAAILLDQLAGSLRREVQAIQEDLSNRNAPSAVKRFNTLLDRAELGRHLTEPWQVVLSGQPNVGKSSLINALVGYGRAIVHHDPGTTRDVVSATTAVDGWPVELSDTAGLHHCDDPSSFPGVELARQRLATAELVVLVFDAGRPWSDADRALVDSWPAALLVHNKSDLPPSSGPPRPRGVATSALTGHGIESLVEGIARRLMPDPPEPRAAIAFTNSQIDGLQAAAEALRRGDLHGSVQALAEM